MRLEGFEGRWRAENRLRRAALLLALALIASSPASAAARTTAGGGRWHPGYSGGRLQLVLPLVANQAGLLRFATEVTTPGDPLYAQFESIPRLAARFGATRRTRRLVLRFLRAAGATDVRIDATGLFADARISRAEAERAFGSSAASFRDARAARPTAATSTAPTSPVPLPRALRGLASGVIGLDTRPLATSPTLTRPPARGRFKDALAGVPSGYVCSTPSFPTTTQCAGTQSGCAAARATGGFTPNEYLTAYGYDVLQAEAARGQGERVALIEIDGFKTRDVDTFARCFGLTVPQINGFGVGSVAKPLPPGGEATLDLEVLDAAAPNLKAIDVYESRSDAADTLIALTEPLQNPRSKPQIISASLGLCEDFTVQDVGRSGIRAAESALAEAAASGITFLAASGDDGSADCTANGQPTSELGVNYPASSPWATGVGGTNFMLNAQNEIIPGSEVVWNDGSADPGAAGGGGFSTLFERPNYQAGVVARNARAVPDVAMLADVAPGYVIYCTATPACINSHSGDPWQTVGGTSAGTPLLAGGFALVDQVLRTHQLQPLGLANPLLYELGTSPTLSAQVFDEVTVGTNDIGPFVGGQPLGCCTATAGYNEASGWGGVNLTAFASQALLIRPKIVDISLTASVVQHPIRSGHIQAAISCTGPCLADAAADVKVGSRRPFVVLSRLYRLGAAGTRAVKIDFSSSQRRMLRAALASRQRIVAVLEGAIVDPAGNVERRSQAIPVTIAP